MHPTTIAEAARALRAGTIRSIDLAEAALAAIDAHNPATNAFILVTAETARAQARDADAELARGVDRGPLQGIPLSLKDLIDVAGLPTTAASKVLADNVATTDAPVVTRLRQAGAVFVGKTNLHEFALGTTSEDSAWGAVRHPRDRDRLAGGSSGGSAVAVATGMGLASIGSDTGGSIRIPASVCGVVGLKPSYDDVPAAGVVPLSTSLDHVGPLARTVEDAGIVWRALAAQAGPPAAVREIRTLRFARLDGYFGEVELAVGAAFDRACAALVHGGARIASAAFPLAPSISEIYVTIALAEAAAWHARFLDTRAGAYSPIVRARIESGRAISAVAYLHALDARLALRRAVDALLDDADAIVLPTLPIVAPRLGQEEAEIGGRRVPVRSAMLRNTQLFNLTGHPAISLPIDAGGWPCGVQIVGRRDDTAALLAIAGACERIL